MGDGERFRFLRFIDDSHCWWGLGSGSRAGSAVEKIGIEYAVMFASTKKGEGSGNVGRIGMSVARTLMESL